MPGNATLFKEGFVMKKNIMDGPHKKGLLLCSTITTLMHALSSAYTQGHTQFLSGGGGFSL